MDYRRVILSCEEMRIVKSEKEFLLHKDQAEFVENTDPYLLWVAGRGAGKTYAGCLKALLWMEKYPGSCTLFVGTTQAYVNTIIKKTFFEVCPPSSISNHKVLEGMVQMKNGSWALFRSLQSPETFAGIDASFLWADNIFPQWEENRRFLSLGFAQEGFPTQRCETQEATFYNPTLYKSHWTIIRKDPNVMNPPIPVGAYSGFYG